MYETVQQVQADRVDLACEETCRGIVALALSLRQAGVQVVEAVAAWRAGLRRAARLPQKPSHMDILSQDTQQPPELQRLSAQHPTNVGEASACAQAAGEGLLTHRFSVLRRQVQVTNALEEAIVADYQPFLFQGVNYMECMLHDLDFMAGSLPLCRLLRIEGPQLLFNPFFAPNNLQADHPVPNLSAEQTQLVALQRMQAFCDFIPPSGAGDSDSEARRVTAVRRECALLLQHCFTTSKGQHVWPRGLPFAAANHLTHSQGSMPSHPSHSTSQQFPGLFPAGPLSPAEAQAVCMHPKAALAVDTLRLQAALAELHGECQDLRRYMHLQGDLPWTPRLQSSSARMASAELLRVSGQNRRAGPIVVAQAHKAQADGQAKQETRSFRRGKLSFQHLGVPSIAHAGDFHGRHATWPDEGYIHSVILRGTAPVLNLKGDVVSLARWNSIVPPAGLRAFGLGHIAPNVHFSAGRLSQDQLSQEASVEQHDLAFNEHGELVPRSDAAGERPAPVQDMTGPAAHDEPEERVAAREKRLKGRDLARHKAKVRSRMALVGASHEFERSAEARASSPESFTGADSPGPSRSPMACSVVQGADASFSPSRLSVSSSVAAHAAALGDKRPGASPSRRRGEAASPLNLAKLGLGSESDFARETGGAPGGTSPLLVFGGVPSPMSSSMADEAGVESSDTGSDGDGRDTVVSEEPLSSVSGYSISGESLVGRIGTPAALRRLQFVRTPTMAKASEVDDSVAVWTTSSASRLHQIHASHSRTSKEADAPYRAKRGAPIRSSLQGQRHTQLPRLLPSAPGGSVGSLTRAEVLAGLGSASLEELQSVSFVQSYDYHALGPDTPAAFMSPSVVSRSARAVKAAHSQLRRSRPWRTNMKPVSKPKPPNANTSQSSGAAVLPLHGWGDGLGEGVGPALSSSAGSLWSASLSRQETAQLASMLQSQLMEQKVESDAVDDISAARSDEAFMRTAIKGTVTPAGFSEVPSLADLDDRERKPGAHLHPDVRNVMEKLLGEAALHAEDEEALGDELARVQAAKAAKVFLGERASEQSTAAESLKAFNRAAAGHLGALRSRLAAAEKASGLTTSIVSPTQAHAQVQGNEEGSVHGSSVTQKDSLSADPTLEAPRSGPVFVLPAALPPLDFSARSLEVGEAALNARPRIPPIDPDVKRTVYDARLLRDAAAASRRYKQALLSVATPRTAARVRSQARHTARGLHRAPHTGQDTPKDHKKVKAQQWLGNPGGTGDLHGPGAGRSSMRSRLALALRFQEAQRLRAASQRYGTGLTDSEAWKQADLLNAKSLRREFSDTLRAKMRDLGLSTDEHSSRESAIQSAREHFESNMKSKEPLSSGQAQRGNFEGTLGGMSKQLTRRSASAPEAAQYDLLIRLGTAAAVQSLLAEVSLAI